MVACVDEQGALVAKGLINYGAAEARKLKGQPSHQIEALLGYVEARSLIHRDNLVVMRLPD
jgi:glutamate 5-kinase